MAGAIAIVQGTAIKVMPFLLVASSDGITGLTGVSPDVEISKNGGTFAPPAGAITEMAYGVYCIEPNALDSDTVGPIWIHATATGADPVDDLVADVSSA